MTSIEKKMLISIGVIIAGLFFSIRSCNAVIEENGGVREIIIGAGKEIKEITKEINEG